jgi:putative transferase (TIGR04331 family)
MSENILPRILVTTPLAETWKADAPTLFLGEWCKAFNDKPIWSKMDAEVAPYHWSDRDKLARDYLYLTDLYERLLPVMSAYLNSRHQVDYSNRYWRILTGPWLVYFLHSVFDKWESVQKADKEYEITETIKIDLTGKDLVPSSMGHLFSGFLFSDYWNHHIFSEIIRFSTTIKQITVAPFPDKALQKNAENKPKTRTLRNRARNLYNGFLSRIAAKDEYFIISSYMSLRNDIELQCRLHQIPKLWSSVVPKWNATAPNRDDFCLRLKAENAFEKFICQILPSQVPKIYMENYCELVITAKQTGWPKQPKVVFTSNAMWHDDVSMAYIAKKLERGAKLVHGQHGGFGIQAYSWAEHHERQIADRYFTWGWSGKSGSNLLPVGLLKPIDKYVSKGADQPALDKLLLVRALTAPYVFRIDSDIGLPQLLNNIKRSFSFVESLPKEIRENNLLVRLYPLARAFSSGGDSAVDRTERFYNEKARWYDQFPMVDVNDGYDKMETHVKRSRLVVYSYNGGTGYLEFIATNIPVIMFWDMTDSPIREEAMPFFDQLRSVGLFHDSPASAANHVAAIWNDIDAWWSSKAVKKVLETFSEQYCKVNRKLVSDISRELKRLANT